MVKNWERVRFCFVVFCFIASPDAAKTDLGRAEIHCGRTRHAARGDGFQARYGLQARRLLRAKISLHPDHCVPACPAEPVTPRAATDFKRYGFKQEYGFQERRLLRAKISFPPDHYIPPCPYGPAISASSRLLPSRLLRSEISLRPAGPSARLCGG